MKRLLFLFSILLICSQPTFAQQDTTDLTGGPLSITVVSDTTDTVANTEDLPASDIEDILDDEALSWMEQIPGGILATIVSALCGTVGIATILFILFILFVLFLPLLLIGLVIYLIFRLSRNSRPQPLHTAAASAGQTARKPLDLYEWRQSQKEEAVIHGAVAAGVAIFCGLYGWKFMMGLSIIFLAYNVGCYYNAWRALKHMDNDKH